MATTVLMLFGTLANRNAEIEAEVNPDAAALPRASWGADTEQGILSLHRGGRKVVRVDLPSAAARDLVNGTASCDLMAHRWSHWDVMPVIRSQGAADVHSATLGAVINQDHLKVSAHAAIERAEALSPDPPHVLALASPASSSGPSLAIVGGISARQILDRSTRGNEGWQSIVALWPDLTDGTDSDRLNARKAVAYACLRTIEALALASSSASGLSIPGLGYLGSAPYDEVLICFSRHCGAETVEDQRRASWLILSTIADRSRGIGKRLEADSVRRVGHQFQPVEMNGRCQARIFAVPRAYKVTVDRHALAARASVWATVAFLKHLLVAGSGISTPLHKRLLDGDALKINKLDPRGNNLNPSKITWSPSRMPPSDVDMKALQTVTKQASGDAISRWEAGHWLGLKETVDQAFFTAEAERLSDGNLSALAAEYDELAKRLDIRIRELRDTERKEAQSEGRLNSLCNAPLGKGRLGMLGGWLTVTDRSRTAGLAYAQSAFQARRARALREKLEEWKGRFEVGTGTAARGLIAQIEHEISEDGLYRRRAVAGWEKLQRPAPNIHRLYSNRVEFETLYYEAQILEERLASGETRIKLEAFKQATQALARDIASALERGTGAFYPLAAAVEAYFQPLFEEHWRQRLFLSKTPATILESALDEAVRRIDPRDTVERRSGKRSDYFYCELDVNDPDTDLLRKLVRERAPSLGFQYEPTVRTSESAIIFFGISSGLALDDIVPLRHDSEDCKIFLEQLSRFHAAEPDAMPVFGSCWFESVAARFDLNGIGKLIQPCVACRDNHREEYFDHGTH